MLEQLAACTPGLRRLLHRLLALLLQPIERDDELDQRVDERQADQQKAEQNELEKGARIVHGGRYNSAKAMIPDATP